MHKPLHSPNIPHTLSMNVMLYQCKYHVIIAGWQSLWIQLIRMSPNSTEMKETSCLPSEGLKCRGISSKTPLLPLPTLKWGLGKGGSWLHPFQSFRCIAFTWDPLGGPCLSSRCSIIGSRYDLAFLLQSLVRTVWKKIHYYLLSIILLSFFWLFSKDC